MELIFSWLCVNYIELTGSLLGIAYVLLATRQNAWCWLMGILNVLIYIFVFYAAGIYGNMGLQVVYLFISMYGWVLWKKGKNQSEPGIRSMTPKHFPYLVLACLGLFGMVYYILYWGQLTTWVGILDSVTTAMGIIGTWMQAKKLLENWLWWILSDVASVVLYGMQGLYPTAVFYFILIILAINGYYAWKKQLQKSSVLP